MKKLLSVADESIIKAVSDVTEWSTPIDHNFYTNNNTLIDDVLMKQTFWQSLNDLIILFTARPIGITLIGLLILKLYSLTPAPSTLIYTLALVLLTALFSFRWGLHLVVRQKHLLAEVYEKEKKR